MVSLQRSYILRFDDLCPTMNWEVWEEIEDVLDLYGLRPIVAVVPDNRDPELNVDPPAADFWERVRSWQAKGWAIALHGYQHRYVNQEAGLIGLNRKSEFAGLSREEQLAKLEDGLAIFRRERVVPRLWVAPGHSFDQTTVDLLGDKGIRIISDGYHYRPHTDGAGMLWIPQQIWGLRWMPPGVWTVCLHHNHWSSRDLGHFKAQLAAYCQRLTDLDTVMARYGGRRSRLAPWVHRLLLTAIRGKRRLKVRARWRSIVKR